MPRFKIETSLYEPVTVEVEGGRTFVSVPFSPQLTKAVLALDKQRRAKELDMNEFVVQGVGLFFGLDPKEIETIDIRVLTQVMNYAMEALNGGPVKKAEDAAADVPPAKTAKPEESPAPGVDEVTAEKNVPKPGGEASQS